LQWQLTANGRRGLRTRQLPDRQRSSLLGHAGDWYIVLRVAHLHKSTVAKTKKIRVKNKACERSRRGQVISQQVCVGWASQLVGWIRAVRNSFQGEAMNPEGRDSQSQSQSNNQSAHYLPVTNHPDSKNTQCQTLNKRPREISKLDTRPRQHWHAPQPPRASRCHL